MKKMKIKAGLPASVSQRMHGCSCPRGPGPLFASRCCHAIISLFRVADMLLYSLRVVSIDLDELIRSAKLMIRRYRLLFLLLLRRAGPSLRTLILVQFIYNLYMSGQTLYHDGMVYKTQH